MLHVHVGTVCEYMYHLDQEPTHTLALIYTVYCRQTDQMADSTPRRAQKRARETPNGQTPRQPRKKTLIRNREGISRVPIRCLMFSAEGVRRVL